MSESITCSNCAACCKARTSMPLTATERTFLRQAGTVLREILPPLDGVDWKETVAEWEKHDPVSPDLIEAACSTETGQGYFVLGTDCGYLGDDGMCKVYEDPQRPKICREFPSGSLGCISIRMTRGIPTKVDVFDVSGPTAEFTEAAQVLLRDFSSGV